MLTRSFTEDASFELIAPLDVPEQLLFSCSVSVTLIDGVHTETGNFD